MVDSVLILGLYVSFGISLVCLYVCVVHGFNLYVSGCVLVVPEVVSDSREVLRFTSAFIFCSRVCRLPSVWPTYCLWHLLQVTR